MMNNLIKLTLTLLLLGLTNPANAAVHNFYESDAFFNCNTGASTNCWEGGSIETHEFDISYDDTVGSNLLSLSVTTSNYSSSKTANGFWLVVSDGPNPKSHVNEYAILYGSAVTGDLYAYQYDGTNTSNSWMNSAGHLETFEDALTTTSFNQDYTWTNGDLLQDRPFVKFDFSIDVTDINNAFSGNDWDGMQFDDNIGIWFHPFRSYDGWFQTSPDGQLITELSKKKTGWYDTGSLPTTTTDVPEPAPLALMLAGLGMLAYSRRKRS